MSQLPRLSPFLLSEFVYTPRNHFTWGHVTIEDMAAKKRKDQEPKIYKLRDIQRSPVGKEAALTQGSSSQIFVFDRIKHEAGEATSSRRWNNIPFRDFAIKHVRVPYLGPLEPQSRYYTQKMTKAYGKLVENQRFSRNRLVACGPDLAAAHFLLYRGCAVKFKGSTKWWQKYSELPRTYQPGYYISAIDASDQAIVYEGLQNVRNLMYLTYLDFSYNEHVDEWFVDRLAGEFGDQVEYLDLSGCVGLPGGGLESLWRFKNLKTLVLNDMHHIRQLPVICLMLLDLNPDLDIRGVDYLNPDALLTDGQSTDGSVEHTELLQDIENMAKPKQIDSG